MKTIAQETKQEVAPATQRTGFYTNIMPVLGKTGEYVYFFLPGELIITEHVNRLKGLLGIDYTPKTPGEKKEFVPRLGLHAKIRIGLSKDGQWVTLYLPGNMGKISNHVNAWKHILGVPYTKKNQAA
jgi:hypothetical protein